MQEATKIDTGPLGGDFSLVPNFGYNLRPIVPAVLYLCTYVSLTWGARASGLAGVLGDLGLTAGLNLGLLLAYNLWYAPVVIIAVAADCLWFHPIPFSLPWAALYCLAISLIRF